MSVRGSRVVPATPESSVCPKTRLAKPAVRKLEHSTRRANFSYPPFERRVASENLATVPGLELTQKLSASAQPVQSMRIAHVCEGSRSGADHA